MGSPFPCARAELDYPLYALDFDEDSRLVVGGGGGAGRSGVGNKISVLEASQDELRVAGEIDLSRDEDSVMSLAVGPHRGKMTYVYAGVNSSPGTIAKGKNEHLRAMAIEQSKSRASVGTKIPEAKLSELSRTSLFANPDADTYQRLLRISGAMGATATAMGKEPQLAVFETSGASPKLKGVLELPKEAEDLDILHMGDNQYQVAFCYKYQLHVVNIGKESGEPHMVFDMPDDHGERPVFRSIRYLSPHFILSAANLPKRSGVVLHCLRLPEVDGEMARLAATARIPRKISATALAVANLTPPASPGAPLGDAQFAIAVAGHDSSISLYTVNHKPGSKINLLTELYPLCTLKDVHGSDNITGLAFSTFIPPKTHIRAQYLKLASISLQKTVAVHSIPLKKHVEFDRPANKKGPPRPVRYIVAMESRGPSARPLIIILSIIVLVMAIVGQSIMEMYGKSPPVLGVHKLLPSWHGTLRSPEQMSAALLEDDFIKKLAGANQPTAGETLVLWESDHPVTAVVEAIEASTKKINLDVHDEKIHGPGKTWEELGEEQKEAWKERLNEVGAWTQGMGESVFKGILFGELAGAVGRAVGG